MLYLEKRHDPRKNSKLIEEITGRKLNTSEAIRETELLLQNNSCSVPPFHDFEGTQGLSILKKLKNYFL
ncbi:MAG: hypothetical protein Q8906_15730, partial [Bacillota bacterium]|nr:hypothetical protein [Bacillota bacterium]